MKAKNLIDVFGIGKTQNSISFMRMMLKYKISMNDIEKELVVAEKKVDIESTMKFIQKNPEVVCPICEGIRDYVRMNTNKKNILVDKNIIGTWFCDDCGGQEDIY